MDCIEARALKSSFLSQMALKTNSHGFYNDDLRCFTGINCVSPDDFPVEDLLNLDFNDKEFQDGCFFLEDDDEKVSQNRNSYDYSSTFSGTDEFDSLSAGELPVPVEDLESLEWLSHFVDDSTSELSLLCSAGSFTGKTEAAWANWSEPSSKHVQKIRYPCFPLKVPGKARSKSRANGRPWSLEWPMLSADESSSTSSSSHGSCTLSPFVFTNPVQDIDWFSSVEKPPAKKQKVKPDVDSGLVSGRRCTHCQVQKTPQWRAGPLGPKTLCNACGVRYKSGRLFPEYRPACSPTFSLAIHSNSHRKVLEMRRQREMHESAAEPGLIPTDRSFEM